MRTRLLLASYFGLVLIFSSLVSTLFAQPTEAFASSSMTQLDQPAAAVQLNVNRTWFETYNTYAYWVVDTRGTALLIDPGERDLTGVSLGLGYQQPLKKRLAFAANLHWMKAQKQVTIDYLESLQEQQPSLLLIPATTMHSLQLVWLDMQLFLHQQLTPNMYFAFGTGVSGWIHEQEYQSALRYNELLEQVELEEFIRRRQLGLNMPISFRMSLVINQHWMVGVEASGHLFFSDEVFDSLGVSFHYFIGT